MSRVMYLYSSIVMFLFIAGCGVYTFSGSSLPSHLKTVDIPQFDNQTLEPNVAQVITQQLNNEVLNTNLLRIVAQNGDATITGRIISYSNTPYTFSAVETRQVDVNQYIVRVVADVQFVDNKKEEPLFKGAVTGEGLYDFQTETEETGRNRAVKQLVDRILQNSLQSW